MPITIPTIKYHLELRETATSTVILSIDDIPTTNYQVENLTPETIYEFRIARVIDDQMQPWSEWVAFETKK